MASIIGSLLKNKKGGGGQGVADSEAAAISTNSGWGGGCEDSGENVVTMDMVPFKMDEVDDGSSHNGVDNVGKKKRGKMAAVTFNLDDDDDDYDDEGEWLDKNKKVALVDLTADNTYKAYFIGGLLSIALFVLFAAIHDEISCGWNDAQNDAWDQFGHYPGGYETNLEPSKNEQARLKRLKSMEEEVEVIFCSMAHIRADLHDDGSGGPWIPPPRFQSIKGIQTNNDESCDETMVDKKNEATNDYIEVILAEFNDYEEEEDHGLVQSQKSEEEDGKKEEDII